MTRLFPSRPSGLQRKNTFQRHSEDAAGMSRLDQGKRNNARPKLLEAPTLARSGFIPQRMMIRDVGPVSSLFVSVSPFLSQRMGKQEPEERSRYELQIGLCVRTYRSDAPRVTHT